MTPKNRQGAVAAFVFFVILPVAVGTIGATEGWQEIVEDARISAAHRDARIGGGMCD